MATAAGPVQEGLKENATDAEKTEAVASFVEASTSVGSTAAIVMLEASGPVGWGIAAAGMFTAFVIREVNKPPSDSQGNADVPA